MQIVGEELFAQFAKSYIERCDALLDIHSSVILTVAVFCFCRFKFGVVSTGEFRDHFVSFFAKTLTTTKNAVTASPAAESKSTRSNSKHRKKKSSKNVKSVDIETDSAQVDPSVSAEIAKNEQILVKIQNIPWDILFQSPGMPIGYSPNFSNSLSAKAESLASNWRRFAQTITDPIPDDYPLVVNFSDGSFPSSKDIEVSANNENLIANVTILSHRSAIVYDR